MYDAGETVAAITRKLRLTRRIVDKWVRLESFPERARMAPKSSTPAKFATYLRDRWAAGERNVRRLLREVREQGYTGCIRGWPHSSRHGDRRTRGRHHLRRSAPCRSTLDRRSDLANRRSGAVHQTTRHAHTAAGREGRCPQAGSADICLHAVTGDAFPRPSARK